MWKTIVNTVKGWNPSVIFYKFLIYAMLVTAACGYFYQKGKNDCENRVAAEAIKGLEDKLVLERQTIIREMQIREKNILTRLSETKTDTIEYNNAIKQLREIQGDLYEATRARTGNAACAPSVQELRALDELAKRTKPRP